MSVQKNFEIEILPNEISLEDSALLKLAMHDLENPNMAARLMNRVGQSVNLAGRALPAPVTKAIAFATQKSVSMALNVALGSLRQGPVGEGKPIPGKPANRLHKSLAVASGALGGLFGIGALAVELPASTVLMLRSIADVARSEGEDLKDPMAALNCLEVFALGGRPPGTDREESGYFAIRAVLAKTVAEAASYVAQQGVAQESAPVLVRLITQIAARFGIVVTEKVAAQAVPIVGALGGAGINYAFMSHFQMIAKAHFTVRRLERRYGPDLVKREYERLRLEK